MKKSIYLSILASISFAAYLPFTSAANTTQAPTEITNPQTEGIWIDVRSAEEYAQGHLANAIHIPHTELAEKITQLTENKSETIHLYCRSGRRAELAKQTLEALGYSHVINHGGYEALIEQGYPTTPPK